MRLDRAATDSYLLGPSDSRRRSSGRGAAASWLESQVFLGRRNQSQGVDRNHGLCPFACPRADR